MTFHHRLAVIMTFCVLQPFILHALNMSPLFKLDFSKAEEWKPSETVFLQKEAETTFLRLKAIEPDKHVMIYRRLYLSPTNRPVALRLMARIRAITIE